MADAVFCHGDNVLHLAHTPAGALAAGQVVVAGAMTYVAPRAVAAGEDGTVSLYGVYKMVTNGTGSAGEKVYWDDTAKKVVGGNGGSGNTHFGFMAPDAGSTPADGVVVKVVHQPDGTTGSA